MIPSLVEQFNSHELRPTDLGTLASLCRSARIMLTSHGELDGQTLTAVVESPDTITATARIYRVSMDGVKSLEGGEITYKGKPGIGLTIEGFEYSDSQLLKFEPLKLPRDYDETPLNSKEKIARGIPYAEAHRIGSELSHSQPSSLDKFNDLVKEWN